MGATEAPAAVRAALQTHDGRWPRGPGAHRNYRRVAAANRRNDYGLSAGLAAPTFDIDRGVARGASPADGDLSANEPASAGYLLLIAGRSDARQRILLLLDPLDLDRRFS